MSIVGLRIYLIKGTIFVYNYTVIVIVNLKQKLTRYSVTRKGLFRKKKGLQFETRRHGGHVHTGRGKQAAAGSPSYRGEGRWGGDGEGVGGGSCYLGALFRTEELFL